MKQQTLSKSFYILMSFSSSSSSSLYLWVSQNNIGCENCITCCRLISCLAPCSAGNEWMNELIVFFRPISVVTPHTTLLSGANFWVRKSENPMRVKLCSIARFCPAVRTTQQKRGTFHALPHSEIYTSDSPPFSILYPSAIVVRLPFVRSAR